MERIEVQYILKNVCVVIICPIIRLLLFPTYGVGFQASLFTSKNCLFAVRVASIIAGKYVFCVFQETAFLKNGFAFQLKKTSTAANLIAL